MLRNNIFKIRVTKNKTLFKWSSYVNYEFKFSFYSTKLLKIINKESKIGPLLLFKL